MRKNAENVILIILIAIVAYSLISLFTSSVVVTNQFYAGVAGLTIAAITRIWNQKLSGLILTGLLAIGIVNIISFSHYTFTFSLNLIPFLKINPLILVFFFAEFLINGPSILKLLSDNSENKTDSGEETDYKQTEIEKFYNMYEKLSDKELEAISDKSNGYVEPARIAAGDILIKRNNGL